MRCVEVFCMYTRRSAKQNLSRMVFRLINAHSAKTVCKAIQITSHRLQTSVGTVSSDRFSCVMTAIRWKLFARPGRPYTAAQSPRSRSRTSSAGTTGFTTFFAKPRNDLIVNDGSWTRTSVGVSDIERKRERKLQEIVARIESWMLERGWKGSGWRDMIEGERRREMGSEGRRGIERKNEKL